MPTTNPIPVSGKLRQGPWRGAPGLLKLLLAGAILLPSAVLAAQNDISSLPYLLFEPVLLKVVTTQASGAETPYTAQELTMLPQGESLELQTWLEDRKTTAITALDAVAGDIAAYEQSVLALEASGGAFEPGLDQELLALGTLLKQAGELGKAQDVLTRALHINRVNNGLFSMGQIPIIEHSIEIHLARGDLVAADAQQEYLLYVQRRNFGDSSVDLLPALTRYAEWNLFAFRARLVAEAEPLTEEERTEVAARPDENSEMMQNFRTSRLLNAHNVYQSIIQILSNNFGATDSRLLNFEKQLALTNYLYITAFGLDNELGTSVPMPYTSTYLMPYDTTELGRPPLGFRQGRDALERRINLIANDPAFAPIDKTQASLDLGDWMLMFSKRRGSLDIYQAAHTEMTAAGAASEDIEAIFNPPFPQEIPTFLEHPYTRKSLDIPLDLALVYKGYIDVEFELSRYGVPGKIQVLNKSSTASPELEGRLLRSIRRTQYRPRIAAGVQRDTETVQARFFFTY